MENFEISTYLSEKIFSRVQNFSRGGRGLRTLRLRFLERGVKTPPAHPWWVRRPFKIYLTLSETDFCVRLVWLADWSQNEVLRIFTLTYVKLILRILRTSVLSNTENIENFSLDFKLGSQKCSQLTFLMKSGYLTTAKCLSNQICKKDLNKKQWY